MGTMSTAEFRNGAKIELDGVPFNIVDFQHVKPGKGGAFVRTKLKSLKDGRVLEKTFRSGEKVDTPDLVHTTMQYLYQAGDDYVFMDNNTYDQVTMTAAQLGDALDFMLENMEVKVLYHQGSPIDVEIPTFMELEIAETDPGVKGDTASGGSKPATLVTGAVVKVPLYIEVGEKIRVDTRTRTYIERAK
ncbi:MAG: elongation factor P [Nitrospirota bacterium]|nr:elongation factor P [Nitrospirota bacterium]